MCFIWKKTGYVKFYLDGKLIRSRDDCGTGLVVRGRFPALGSMENRKTSNWVFMTGFVLWDIILTDEEILKSTKTCDGTNGNPVVKWEDFYPLAESNAADFVLKPSTCQALK